MLNLKTDKMKTFDSGLNDITVDENNLITKIDFRDCWFFDVELHPELHECLNCFEDNVLNEFKISQPRDMYELRTLIKEQWDYWKMDSEFNSTVYDWDENTLKIGFGYKPDDNWEYMTVTTPMIIFKLKA